MGNASLVSCYLFYLLITYCNGSSMSVCVSGLANYCVPAGEAYQKALDIACEITQKVRVILNLIFQRKEFLHELTLPI